ncbi:MAG: hypothetical protein ABEJ35_07550 [Halobacteriaceae archaeon]
MHRLATAGWLCTALSLLGYAAGVVSAYPGRALVIPGALVGVTLVALGGQ